MLRELASDRYPCKCVAPMLNCVPSEGKVSACLRKVIPSLVSVQMTANRRVSGLAHFGIGVKGTNTLLVVCARNPEIWSLGHDKPFGQYFSMSRSFRVVDPQE